VIIAGWVREVLDQLVSISLPLLLLALTLHTCETLLNALAWRNILRRAYPDSRASYRLVLGAYGGGIGLNAILPAQAGTVAMLSLYRAQIQASTALGLVGAGVVQNAFFLLAGASTCVGIVVFRPSLFSLHLGSLVGHATLAVGAALVAVLVAWIVRRRLHDTWAGARDGAAILATPRAYVSDVLLVEVASYVARICVTATFMRAYDVPVSPRSVVLILAVNAVASTVAFTPGGVGTQQALATAALRSTAPSSVVAAFSFGQQLILAAWDIAFGLLLLWSTIGWTAARALVHAETPMPLPARGGARPMLAEQRQRAVS
jgi:uncharacterized membrane protein YbhN (UPF0104 family)